LIFPPQLRLPDSLNSLGFDSGGDYPLERHDIEADLRTIFKEESDEI
jgi:hypothetical protein